MKQKHLYIELNAHLYAHLTSKRSINTLTFKKQTWLCIYTVQLQYFSDRNIPSIQKFKGLQFSFFSTSQKASSDEDMDLI